MEKKITAPFDDVKKVSALFLRLAWSTDGLYLVTADARIKLKGGAVQAVATCLNRENFEREFDFVVSPSYQCLRISAAADFRSMVGLQLVCVCSKAKP